MRFENQMVPGQGLEPPFIPSPDLQAEPQGAWPSLTIDSLLGPALMPRALAAPTILMFDSGLGGLTVHREVVRARPDATIVYAADDAVFPYGGIPEDALIERVCTVMERLIAEYRPDLVVIACNTASTIVLPALRQRFAVPFVGTVPAIKPACAATATGRVSVLGTLATVKREYTRALIRQYGGNCRVTLVGAARLAGFAEAELSGDPAPDADILAEIRPCFVDDGARTDTLVLACTHYPLLRARIEQLAPWPVRIIDPAPAIARRVVDLVGMPGHDTPAPGRIIFTSGQPPSAALASALATFGFGAPELRAPEAAKAV